MYCIGIAGRSGSGKTRVAAELARMWPQARVLGTDAYYRDLSQLSVAERGAVNFDAPAALDWELLVADLTRLRSGASARVPRYDFATHTRMPEPALLAPSDVLILEGLFALFDRRVRGMLDLAVFIDAAEEECLSRRIERDIACRGRTEAFSRAQWKRHSAPMYELHVAPTRAYAELFLDGTAAPVGSARSIAEALACIATASGER
ncbi:MAG: uridine kinase [Acidobacteriia bacterium]|nr:uridine kinase [Terriglobia bacterium]MYG03442.1 uridine kinase [Terriglobia bacterium]MYK09307.1 uridine kinase [Terriglobia bacterium]